MAGRLAAKPGRVKQPVGKELGAGLPQTKDRKRKDVYVLSYKTSVSFEK